jgi:hypothetical protein
MFDLFNGIISLYAKNLGTLMELMTHVQDNIVTMYQNGADYYFFEVSRLSEVQLHYLRNNFEINVVERPLIPPQISSTFPITDRDCMVY